MTDIDNLRTAAILRCSDMPEGHLPGGLGRQVKNGCGRHFVVWTQRSSGQWVCPHCGKRSRANLNGGGSRIVVRTGYTDRTAARDVAEALDEGQKPMKEAYPKHLPGQVYEPDTTDPEQVDW